MQQVIEWIDQGSCLIPLGDLDGVFHGVKGEVKGILRALVRLVMLELALVHELAHLPLIGINVEGVRLKDDETNPSPSEPKHRFVEEPLLRRGELCSEVLLSPVFIEVF